MDVIDALVDFGEKRAEADNWPEDVQAEFREIIFGLENLRNGGEQPYDAEATEMAEETDDGEEE